MDENQARMTHAIMIAGRAGEILLRYWHTALDIAYKVDEFDPVTRADQECDEFLREEILKKFPSDLILSEENSSIPESYDGRVWMVDPLDDTKAFTKGLDAFAISIGCVENGVPKVGVVYAPARGIIYYATKGSGAFAQKGKKVEQIFGSAVPTLSKARIVKKLPSKDTREFDLRLAQIKPKSFVEDGSIALALGRLAAGDAECTMCTNPRVSKWDSAGGQAILEEVGGVVTDTRGLPLDYKQEGRGWPHLIVASTNPTIHKEFIAALQSR